MIIDFFYFCVNELMFLFIVKFGKSILVLFIFINFNFDSDNGFFF